MPISEGLRTSLNEIRQTSIDNNTLYAKQIDDISPNADISVLSAPLLDNPELMNEFMSMLIKRIVYTQLVNYKLFNNPLSFLEGDQMPLGSIGQEIHINPAKGRRFDVNDFAGLLAKYEADVKVQYMHLNSDVQYPVTITRAKLKDAFVSWANLESFINGITQSLYNGAYIDRYNFTKGLIASAYRDNNVKIEIISEPNTEELAKQFLTKARTLFLNFQEPSADYNAWRQVGGYGRDVITWSNRDDIVLFIRNDIGAYLDVNILSQAFNIDSAKLLGRVKYVKDFTERDANGNVIIDGSNIVAMIADQRWFRIKNQEITMDEFYNANNRTWQMYLNDVNMYQYSLFCNAVVFATEAPVVNITKIEFEESTVTVPVGEKILVPYVVTPANANTPHITASGWSNSNISVTQPNQRSIEITGGPTAGSTKVTLTADGTGITANLNVTVTNG